MSKQLHYFKPYWWKKLQCILRLTVNIADGDFGDVRLKEDSGVVRGELDGKELRPFNIAIVMDLHSAADRLL